MIQPYETTDLKKADRTEEVQEIIDRMPTNFGIKISIFVVVLVSALFSFGWIIKYPDVVTGTISINASSPPIKLISNTSGKLRLNGYKNHDDVQEGAYIATLLNAANLNDVQRISLLIKNFSLKDSKDRKILASFPRDVSLGELNGQYFTFLNAYTHMVLYWQANIYDKRTEILEKLITEYEQIMEISKNRAEISEKNLVLVDKFSNRNSILFSKKVVSESENDRAKMTRITAEDAHQNMLKEVSVITSQLRQTENELQQNQLQKSEKEKQLELNLITAYTELENNLKIWEQKYVFKAPMDGKIQFLKFWADNQFIQSGEPVFTVVPNHNNVLGQMTLPVQGAGKVKIGQEVIIKLEDYPYMEYGSIKGIVSDISMTTNALITQGGAIENYLINVELPEKLKTNYGSELDFRYEIKGTGDIITRERQLIQRLFDNLRYKLNQ